MEEFNTSDIGYILQYSCEKGNEDDFEKSAQYISDNLNPQTSHGDSSSQSSDINFLPNSAFYVQINLQRDSSEIDSSPFPTQADFNMSLVLSPNASQYDCQSVYSELIEAITGDSKRSRLESDDDESEVYKYKRNRIFQIIDTTILMKNIHFQRYYEPLRTDYRHIYPALMFETITSYNIPFLKEIIHRIVREDCTMFFAGQLEDAGGNGFAETNVRSTRPHIWELMLNLSYMIPDIVFTSNNFKLCNLSHVPSTFKSVPVKLFNVDDLDHLNAYLIDFALLSNEELSPGTAIIGTMYAKGTIVRPGLLDIDLPIVGSNLGYAVTEFKDIYIFCLDDMGRIIRFESFTLPFTIDKSSKVSRVVKPT